MKRYKFEGGEGYASGMVFEIEDPYGEYIKFEDFNKAIQQERERCAKIAENAIASDSPLIAWDEFPNERKGNVWNTALLIAAAIRCDCQTLNQFHTVDCASNKDEK